ncbi:MAG: PAS domain S-box protein, partial [Acidimicrobiaceae bacterium]|nr:PAS domain S-box protein [Acidimicrobiaceae bacterium]
MAARLNVDPDALLATMIDAAEDPVLVCDSDGRITTWGDAAARLFGRAADAAVGLPFVEMFAEDVRPEVLAILLRAAAGERIDRFESECVRADGMPVPVSINVSPVLGPDVVTRALVAVVRDETERRLAQATLAEADARLREGEAFSHVGSWLWDIRTNVVQWSVEFHRIHGVDPLDFGGTLDAYLQSVHPSDRETFRNAITESVKT